FPTYPATVCELRSYTTISCPSRMQRSVMLPPMRPKPTMPSCMISSPLGCHSLSTWGSLPGSDTSPPRGEGTIGGDIATWSLRPTSLLLEDLGGGVLYAYASAWVIACACRFFSIALNSCANG